MHKAHMSIGTLTTAVLGVFLPVLLPSAIHNDLKMIERTRGRETNRD